MTCYAIVNLIPSDMELLAEYRKLAKPALETFGGAAIAAGPAHALETAAGALNPVVLSFPDEAAAQAWFDAPELAKLHAMRNQAAKSSITLIPGV